MIGASTLVQNPKEVDLYLVKRTPEPFLFSVTALTPEDLKWSLDYPGSYGERVSGPSGYNGINQQLAVKGYTRKTIHSLSHVQSFKKLNFNFNRIQYFS